MASDQSPSLKRRKLETLEVSNMDIVQEMDGSTFCFDFDPKLDLGLDIDDFSKEIIETDDMKSFCYNEIQENNHFIVGPKGVGKTTFLLYALSKVRSSRKSVCICLSATMMNTMPPKVWIKNTKLCLTRVQEGINWRQNVELIMTEIVSKLLGNELYLFMDEGSEATTSQLLKFYSIAKVCIRRNWKVVFASTSGCGFHADKSVCSAATFLMEHFQVREILPFTIKEAYQFLESHQVDKNWQEEIVFSAGTVPMMLKVFVNTHTKRDFSRKLSVMTNLIEIMISHLKFCKQDSGGRYQSSLVESFTWLAKASVNATITPANLDYYYKSYVARENLTFIVEKKKSSDYVFGFQENSETNDTAGPRGVTEKNLMGMITRSRARKTEYQDHRKKENDKAEVKKEKSACSKKRETHDRAMQEDVEYIIFLSYPRSYTGLRNALLNVVPREKYNSPSVKGFFFEKDFFVKTVTCDHQWKIRAKTIYDDTERCITFSGISGASEQENGHISVMEGNKIYYLHAGHKAIDAVVRARGNDDIVYLILIQISLTPYSKHDSKYDSIFTKLKEPGNDKSILEYYSFISGVATKNSLYLYVCPKQLLKPDQEIDSFIDIISGCTTRSGKIKPPHLIGLLEADCDISAALCSLENDLSDN